MRRLYWVFVVVAGCVPLSYTFTPESAKPISPKPDNCKVEVLTTAPDGSYEVVGTLEQYNGTPTKNVDKFRSAVDTQVCQAGGDAVIAIANEKGEYSKGSVIKYAALPMATPLKSVNTPPPQSTDTEVPKQ